MIEFLKRKYSGLSISTKLIIIILLIIIISFFSFRNQFLNILLNQKIQSFNTAHQAKLKIEKVKFKGIFSIQFNNIILKPLSDDTLLKINKLTLRLSFWKAVFKQIKVKNVILDGFYLNIRKDHTSNNYSFLLNQPKDSTHLSLNGIKDDSKLCRSFSANIFRFLPDKTQIQSINITIHLYDKLEIFHLSDFTIKNHNFNSFIEVDNGKSVWAFEGTINPAKQLVEVRIHNTSTTRVSIPLIMDVWKLRFEFDTLALYLNTKDLPGLMFGLSGNIIIRNLLINHPKISSEDVKINNFSFLYHINVGKDYFELDSSSNIKFNDFDYNPYIKYTPQPARKILLTINKPRFDANTLFSSLPPGLFHNLQGIKSKGELSYYLRFFYDSEHPDSIVLNSVVRKYGFSITNFNNLDIFKLNSPFTYTAYEQGVPVASFVVGPEYPDFRYISQISPYLKTAVLLSEDINFYYHRGFDIDGIKLAMKDNIKSHKFLRGGSTITQQMVKNVFLTRKKTITRKIEEMGIVWLLENNGWISKDRIFEIYLNIIEWGPGIYGANRASRFYFNKDVSKLTLEEAIYLAAIIPRPKYFQYHFISNGQLKDYFTRQMEMIKEKMLITKAIDEDQADKFIPTIKLTGLAKDRLIVTDSIPFDTNEIYIH